MAEQMLFPDTWEEFEKQYMMVDKKQIYSNGTEYIPCFRVRQWMERIEAKKKNEANKMAEVAAMFGKKLGEEFGVVKEECGFAYVKFTEDGLRMVHHNGKVFTRNDIEDFGFSVDLEDLITGTAVIVDE